MRRKQKFGFLSMYICEYDHEMLQSDIYSDLSNVIHYRIAAASATNREGMENDHNSRQKLANLNVMHISRAKDIKDDDQLLTLAENNYD